MADEYPDITEITPEDLPPQLARDLLDFIKQQYPREEVSIYISPLIMFNQLPPELLSKVMRSDAKLGSKALYVSKAVHDNTVLSVYESECNKPITIGEIHRAIENDPDAILINIGNYTAEILDTFTYNDQEKQWKTRSKVTQMIHRVPNRLTIEITLDYGVDIKDTHYTLDLFTAYNVRKLRKVCIKQDPRYADKKLVEDYNELFAIDFEVALELVDYMDVFILNHIAFKIAPKTVKLDRRSSIGKSEKFYEAYEHARRVISHKVRVETGAIFSQLQPEKLMLR